MLYKNRGKKCPYTRKPCMERDCMLWGELQGKDPKTGNDTVVEGCTEVLNTFLLRDLGKRMNEVSASTDTLRSETVKRQDTFLQLEAVKLKRMLTDAYPKGS